ncbi:hypothetical protein [Streptomyces chartreusis]|uniref:hypothetical protein n=1 Tax=Streptomyces chartreusis TaxID=1969 RepID=UPI00365468BB
MGTALVAAGAALLASLVTGVFTWLSGRSHVSLQVADQRQARHEQLRRDVYARAVELLTTEMYALVAYERDQWGNPQAFADIKRERSQRTQQIASSLAELQLVGPRSLADLMQETHARLDALEHAYESTLASPHPSSDEDVDRFLTPRVDEAGEFLERFCDSARRALGLE